MKASDELKKWAWEYLMLVEEAEKTAFWAKFETEIQNLTEKQKEAYREAIRDGFEQIKNDLKKIKSKVNDSKLKV